MSEPRGRGVIRSPVTGRYFKGSSPELGRGGTGWMAGAVMPDDIADVQAVTILDEVYGLARVQYKLRNLCRPVRMDRLTARIDIAGIQSASRKVPPMVEADIMSPDWSKVDFDLWKNVGHVVIADESGMKAAHDLMTIQVTDAARALAYAENEDIKDELETNITEKVAGTPYLDWGAFAAGVSTNDPMLQIQASIAYIEGQGYPPDFLAMHPTLWNKFITNTWIRDLVHSGILQLAASGATFSLPGWPTIEIFVDWGLTETPTGAIGPIVGSRAAPGAVLGEGPWMAEKYRNVPAGYDAYVIRQWLEPKITLNAALDMICT